MGFSATSVKASAVVADPASASPVFFQLVLSSPVHPFPSLCAPVTSGIVHSLSKTFVVYACLSLCNRSVC